MKMKKLRFFLVLAGIIGLISGCGNSTDHSNHSMSKTETKQSESKQHDMDHSEMDHSEMNHSSSGELPKGLKEAKNPTYQVGSQVLLQTEHMKGMKDATATIVGAYETFAYVVSYTPTTGGAEVKNHKWVVHEEIKNPNNHPLKPGAKVVLDADHMTGMKGATATIDSVEKTTVYMVDYTPTTGGEKVKNHKWITESEISPK